LKNSIIHKTLFLIVGLLCAKSNGQDLNNLKWTNRILIVKTLNTDSEKFNKQLNLIQERSMKFHWKIS